MKKSIKCNAGGFNNILHSKKCVFEPYPIVMSIKKVAMLISKKIINIINFIWPGVSIVRLTEV